MNNLRNFSAKAKKIINRYYSGDKTVDQLFEKTKNLIDQNLRDYPQLTEYGYRTDFIDGNTEELKDYDDHEEYYDRVINYLNSLGLKNVDRSGYPNYWEGDKILQCNVIAFSLPALNCNDHDYQFKFRRINNYPKFNDDIDDQLIPQSGPARTLIGEILRAIQRIMYRKYNDGDNVYWRQGGNFNSFITLGTLLYSLDSSESEIIVNKINELFDEYKYNRERFGEIESPVEFIYDDIPVSWSLSYMHEALCRLWLEDNEFLSRSNRIDSREIVLIK